MKLKQQTHLLVKSLNAILNITQCNIDMIMWFCLSVIFLLIKELSLPNLDSRCISQREISSQFFTGTGNTTVPSISKKHHTLNWENQTFGFYDHLYTKMFKLLFVGFIFFIVTLQTFFLALRQNPFNGFFSMMNQIESNLIFQHLTRDINY